MYVDIIKDLYGTMLQGTIIHTIVFILLLMVT